MINKALTLDCPDPAETYSNSPHLYTELDIPAEAGGRIGGSRAKPARAAKPDSSEPRPARDRDRARRRTRGGKAATGHVERPAETAAPAAEGKTGDGAARRRRRRRRPGKAAAPAN